MTPYILPVKKTRWALWITVGLLTAATVLISMWFMAPPPPKTFVLATGQRDGAYDTFGKEYQRRLDRMGLRVEIVNTGGAVDNLQLLAGRKVDVAFVQGGTAGLLSDDQRKDLRGLASVYLEPLWVFYRGKAPVDSLADFKGKKISIGPKNSGAEAVSTVLLSANRINSKNSELKNLPSAEAREALRGGQIDVAMFVSSYKDKALLDLMRERDINLLNFRRDVAYSREFPYLTASALQIIAQQ